ncbi:beta-alanine-activating enzyme [Scomber scombrus]|uniref:Beta-alanine-activating enzyme n=1 Tax=Scomber scombrus TaxID=13677 RepID=A0AAV1NAA3_SCOSC
MAAGTLQALAAAAASLYPHRTAVTYDDGSAVGSPVSLRYRDLSELTDELSLILREKCSPHNGVIGLYCSDDLFTPVWILGILQSPAAYVPLDPDAPGLLSARVMNQCCLKFCAVKTDLLQRFQAALTQHVTAEVCVVLPKFKLTLVRVKPLLVSEHARGTEQTSADLCAPAAVLKDAGQRDLAYVLHTSGTTGLPKIVRVPHKCILPNIHHLRSMFQVSQDDVVFLASPLTFDPSAVEIFLALSSGAQLLIIPPVIKKIPNRLAQLLFRHHKTTVLQVTPTLLGRFGQRVLKQEVLSSGSSLRVLALGGESCPSPSLLSSWRHEDNKTHIYNIYGITEVSCWACCYKVPQSLLQFGNTTVSSVPLGTPLMDTVVEVRDEHGCVVTEGEGQAFIGGEDRVCLLDDEETVVPRTMRATGDWVSVRDSQLYYLGRRDRTIKRHGKRMNLDSVQHLIMSLPQVEACAVSLYEGSRLLAFVVTSTSGEQSVVSPLPSAQQHAEQTPPASAERQEDVEHHQVETGGTDGDLSGLILKQLSLLLPSYSLPDTLVLVPALPLTPHGKVDMQALRKIYQRQRESLESDSSRGDITKLKLTLQSLWQDTLGLAENAAIEEESNFLFSGGDSLKALRLCEDILAATGATSPQLLEVVLDGTFSDVLRHVSRVTLMLPVEKSPSSASEAAKRQDDAPSVVLGKRKRKDSTAAEKPQEGCYDGCVYFLCAASGETRWTFETGDAVKSCPAVDPLTGLVMVGSHDGHVYALNPKVRQCVWKHHCGGGAVFSSPYLNASHRQLYAASLGGHLLCLNADSGQVLWSYCRDIPFFSSPSGSSGDVVIGSVDGNICCFSSTGKLLWQFLTKGPVFSSPCVTPDLQRVLCGSHDGSLYCLNRADGSLVWTFQTSGKVYASPCVFDGSAVGRRGILVGLASTDGTIWILDVEDGQMLASFTLPGELFSSPVVWKQSLIIGCRNDYVYCLKLTAKEET